MDKGLITQQIREIAAAALQDGDIELVHVETAGTKREMVVRIFIDKEGGVTLDDCSSVSRSIEDILDARDTIPTRYVLEVSSPGIERELYSLADFVKFAGRLVKVKTNVEVDGQKTHVGTIKGVDGQTVTLDERSKGEISFEYSDVSKANLRIDLAKEFGQKQQG